MFTPQEVEAIIKGIRVGMCNYKGCDCHLENVADGFCSEHWALLERDKRQELVFERNRFVKNKRKYWFTYSMALAGAKIYLRA